MDASGAPGRRDLFHPNAMARSVLRVCAVALRSVRMIAAARAGSVLVAALFIMTTHQMAAASALKVDDLFCQSGRGPVVLDDLHPRLSWRLTSTGRNARQSSYRIQVASTRERLLSGRADRWDSGRVASDQSIQVAYAGRALQSRDECWWRVRVWDSEGAASEFSVPGYWEMGLLSATDWQAEWIGYSAGWTGRALYFRHVFEITRPVRRARAYVAGLGYYELRINGEKIGDHVLDPAWTDYSRRVLYVTHDIGAKLSPGRNAVGVIVGHGWYGAPQLRLQIELTYEDGTREIVATQGGHSHAPDVWFVSTGAIVTDSIYDGETFDARLEKSGWDRPTPHLPESEAGRTEGWETAVQMPAPAGGLVAQTLEPIKVVASRRPARRSEPRPGIYVFDTGQNLAGWAAVRVTGPRGTAITLRFAESLRADGTINDENLRKARATDTYILHGQGVEEWEPRFTYHGFRYIQVENWPGVPALEDLKIQVVRSAVEPVGSFSCSDPLLNRIHEMVAWTEASNLHGLPTDCPQRDERMGWMNDMTVRIEPALYKFRLARFYAKFLSDVADTQDASGAITDTAPFKWGKRPADPVSASYLLLAWEAYLHYGDIEPMRTHYAGMCQWVDFLANRAGGGVLRYSSWGDWAPPESEAVAGSIGAGAVSAKTPGDFISTGYLYYQAALLARMAHVLGDESNANRYQALAERVERVFQRYWDEAVGGYGSNNQACNAFALFLGIVPDDRIERVTANLTAAVHQAGDHLTTGNLCTKYLLEMLTDHGQAELAYRIATQKSYPSWGFMLENDATTLWERWEHRTGGAMNSHNHPMLGSVDSWFFKYLGGIRSDETHPGFRRFIVAPCFLDELSWVDVSYDVLQGTIHSAWRREADRLILSLSVPTNTRALIRLPVGSPQQVTERAQPLQNVAGLIVSPSSRPGMVEFEVGAGAYEFTAPGR